MKVTIIAGARPNFMKIAPLMRAIKAAKAAGKNITARLVYTGSDEDKSLEPSLFTDLDMPRPDVYLHVDNTDFFQRMAGILVAFARELEQHPAQVVLVVDDLTPTMACSIVAKKKGIKVAHLVAGTRSFDMDMPKEVNSMITDGLSDYLFTAGMVANRNLNQTGTEQAHVHFVGIQPDEAYPGFKQFILKPMPDPTGKMKYARGYYDSMYGRIESSWREERGMIHYAFYGTWKYYGYAVFAGCIVERCPRRGETYPKMQGNRIYW